MTIFGPISTRNVKMFRFCRIFLKPQFHISWLS
jgi:hypothetical protein